MWFLCSCVSQHVFKILFFGAWVFLFLVLSIFLLLITKHFRSFMHVACKYLTQILFDRRFLKLNPIGLLCSLQAESLLLDFQLFSFSVWEKMNTRSTSTLHYTCGVSSFSMSSTVTWWKISLMYKHPRSIGDFNWPVR